ncbi:MAG: PIN domain-containing protein [Bryobacteraceae bacterium]
MKYGLDASCLVPLVLAAHPRHDRTLAAKAECDKDNGELILTAHALLECYAVLTRLPKPHGIAPPKAEELLKLNFGTHRIVGMTRDTVWATLRSRVSRGQWGARVFDSVIALSTLEAGGQVLLSWNARHLLDVAPPGLEIREP